MTQKEKSRQQGKIIVPAGALPEKHELETASFFATLGKDVEFQLPSRTKGVKTPDALIDGVLFEMKSPIGGGKRTLQTCLQRATKQSKNIIIDLRHTALKTDYCLSILNREFKLRSSIKRLIIITKSERNALVVLER
jgi:hypothetical protein